MSEALEMGVIISTVGLTYVTALPYEIRKAHRDKVVRVGSNMIYLCHFHGRLALLRVVHHGRWLAWQLTALLPGRYRDR